MKVSVSPGVNQNDDSVGLRLGDVAGQRGMRKTTEDGLNALLSRGSQVRVLPGAPTFQALTAQAEGTTYVRSQVHGQRVCRPRGTNTIRSAAIKRTPSSPSC